MNLLQMAQRVRRECGIPGTISSVTGQVGEAQRVVDWVISTWTELQGEREDYTFLRRSFSRSIAANTTILTAPDEPVLQYLPQTFRYFDTAVGRQSEQFMTEWDYDDFRNTYLFGNQNLQVNPPGVFAEHPVTSEILLPPTDRGYTIIGDYQRTPVVLAEMNDTPAILPHFHMLIVWRAVVDYGYHEAASEVLAKAGNHIADLHAAFERKYLPTLRGV